MGKCREALDWIIGNHCNSYQPINTEVILIGHEKSREEGEKQAKIAVAKNLLKAGVSIDLIAESTGLPQAEIAQLLEETF